MFIGYFDCDVSAALTGGRFAAPHPHFETSSERYAMKEKGEIQKRLDDNLCPWCMSTLRLIEDTYVDDKRKLTRQCSQCRGTVVDEFKFGEQHGDDPRSKGEEESHQHT